MHVSVRVTAGAKKEKVEVMAKGRLKISVKEAAEHNLANRRVLALVAAYARVPQNKVRLISGHRSPSKLFDIAQ